MAGAVWVGVVEEEDVDFVVLVETLLEVVFEVDLVDELDFVLVDFFEVVADLDVDVEVLDVEEGLIELLVIDETLFELLLLLARDESMYISRRFPAPQYSYWFPGQINEQSERVVLTDPVLGDVPQ